MDVYINALGHVRAAKFRVSGGAGGWGTSWRLLFQLFFGTQGNHPTGKVNGRYTSWFQGFPKSYFFLKALEFFSRKLRERVLLKNSCSIDHQHDKTIADHQPLTTANDKTIADQTIADHQPLTTANDQTIADETIADHQPLTTANDKTIADQTIADHQPLTTANDQTIADHQPLTTAT